MWVVDGVQLVLLYKHKGLKHIYEYKECCSNVVMWATCESQFFERRSVWLFNGVELKPACVCVCEWVHVSVCACACVWVCVCVLTATGPWAGPPKVSRGIVGSLGEGFWILAFVCLCVLTSLCWWHQIPHSTARSTFYTMHQHVRTHTCAHAHTHDY